MNPIFRKVIQSAGRLGIPIRWIASLYRPYGVVRLKVADVGFRVLSKSDDLIASEIYYGSNYESGEFALLKALLPNCKTFVDIGANTGMFSIFAALVNRSLRVISCEPYPSNFDRLQTNIGVNDLAGRVEVAQFALGADARTIELTVPVDLGISTVASPDAAFTRNFHLKPCMTIQVNQETLDSLLENVLLDSCDLIKIDVEYYELEVLAGASETLRRRRPLVLIEVLSYDSLVQQFPGMKGMIARDHDQQLIDIFTGAGYFGYTVEDSGLTLLERTDFHGARNVLFVPRRLLRVKYSFDSFAQELHKILET